MARMPKCKHCKKDVNKDIEQFIKKSSGYYHQECHDIIEKENKFRDMLINFIKELYNIDFPTGFMLGQIKEYRTVRNYTYQGMILTLKYMYEVENIPVKEGTGLGLITFNYEKAIKYYNKLRSNKASAKGAEIQREPQIVIVEKQERKRKPKLLDMREIQ